MIDNTDFDFWEDPEDMLPGEEFEEYSDSIVQEKQAAAAAKADMEASLDQPLEDNVLTRRAARFDGADLPQSGSSVDYSRWEKFKQ